MSLVTAFMMELVDEIKLNHENPSTPEDLCNNDIPSFDEIMEAVEAEVPLATTPPQNLESA